MRKEIALASALLLGGGAGVEAQTPTPIVEEEKIDVSSFMEAVRANLNYDAEPHFFDEMERRARDIPSQYFKVSDLPDGTLTLYHPRGLDGQAKVGVVHTQNNILIDDIGGPLNAFQTYDSVKLDLGKNGTLSDNSAVDLFNFKEIRTNVEKYLIEPDETKPLDWQERDASPASPAQTFKLAGEGMNGVYFGGDQKGFLSIERVVTEIPIVGTDIPAN